MIVTSRQLTYQKRVQSSLRGHMRVLRPNIRCWCTVDTCRGNCAYLSGHSCQKLHHIPCNARCLILPSARDESSPSHLCECNMKTRYLGFSGYASTGRRWWRFARLQRMFSVLPLWRKSLEPWINGSREVGSCKSRGTRTRAATSPSSKKPRCRWLLPQGNLERK